MLKKIWIVSILISFSFSVSFKEFKELALKNNPYIDAISLSKDSIKEQTKILTRYKNPTLNLELSNFDIAGSSSELGYSASLNQPIRLWGVYDAKKDFANAKQNEIEKQIAQIKAKFIRDLSLLYVDYKTANKVYELSKKMLNVSKKILDISKQRYENGTISKAKYFQAEVDFYKFKNSVSSINIKKQESYYNLLKYAKIKDDIELEISHNFSISNQNNDISNSYDLVYIDSKEQASQKQSNIFSNKIEWSQLYLTYEKEPDQDIYRAGFNIPIAIFNQRKEESKVALLESKRYKLLKDSKQNELSFELKKINTNLKNLQELKKSTKELISSQEKLLEIYEDSYKIANTDIIELQIVRNNLINSKLKLIQIEADIEKNIINYNYITGAKYE